MRIAVFSDVHGNLPALIAVLRAIDGHRPVHFIVAVGDHCLVGDQPAAVWDMLQAAGCIGLLGNEDIRIWRDKRSDPKENRWTAITKARIPWYQEMLGDERLAALQALPRSVRFSPAPGQDILFVHANVHGPYGFAFNAEMPDATLQRLYGGANARVICCGHYHQAAVREWQGTTLVNVASVSLPVDEQPLAGYTLLNWNGTAWHVTQYRVPYDQDDQDV